jgi:hypothetical protein
MKDLNFNQQVAAFQANNETFNDNNCFFFYDWFCKESSLERKAKDLMVKAQKLMGKLDLDPSTHYVFFKNNCPGDGSLYDSISICEVESGDVKVWCTPRSGHRICEGRAELSDFRRGMTLEMGADCWTNLLKRL